MRIIIRKGKFPGNPDSFLKKAGYSYVMSRKSGQLNYSRRLGASLYPRFHLYVSENQDTIIFNLHLDQQKTAASYSKSKHKGEYDGEIVKGEVNRLKQLIVRMVKNKSN